MDILKCLKEAREAMDMQPVPSHEWCLFFETHDLYQRWCGSMGIPARPRDEFGKEGVRHNGILFYVAQSTRLEMPQGAIRERVF